MSDSKNNYGVINEQGYPVGQFGFNPLSEQEKAAIDKNKNSKPDDIDDTNKKG
jgi:hypothetical protein